jgi:hypothetical protein
MSGPKKPTDTMAMKGMYSNIEDKLRTDNGAYTLVVHLNRLDSITIKFVDPSGEDSEVMDHFSVGEVMDALERKLEEKAGTLFPCKGA